MIIKTMKIDELIPASYNPRKDLKPGDQEYENLKRSIKEFGYVDPIIWNEQTGNIIGGHQRAKIMKDLGMTEAEVSVVDLPDEKEKVLNLALNKITGQWDMALLKELIIELETYDIDITLTGFDTSEIEELLDPEIIEDDFDAEAEAEKITVPVTKRGDIYLLGRHRLMCGDSTSHEDVEQLMANEKARLIFTDPPYGVDYKSPAGYSYNSTKFGGTGGKIFNDNLPPEEGLEFYRNVLKNLYVFSTDDAAIYWWYANKNVTINRTAFEATKWHMSQIIIWLKNSPILSRGQDYHRCYEPCMMGWKKGKSHYTNKRIKNYRDVFSLDVRGFEEQLDVWYQRRDNTAKYLHPTQKPVRLAERAIKKNSRQNDIVLDAFGGSGSTLIACEQMERICYLMELDPKYCDVIVKRYEIFTGKGSVLIDRERRGSVEAENFGGMIPAEASD
jgi:DNA modification methylase